MISLILPYWDRQQAADRALATLAGHYLGLDLEVIVVDDGNREPFRSPADYPLDLHVVRLPRKEQPTPQSRAWNAGAKASTGDILALSCVEVLHPAPVLEELAAQLAALGPYGYVLAAAWCPERREWHCRSDVRSWDGFPPGYAGTFLSVLNRDLFDLAGGFDEEYMGGAGYEDRDFVCRLLAAGARFMVRDDLVVHHPKTGATIKWPAEGFARNENVFKIKWPNH